MNSEYNNARTVLEQLLKINIQAAQGGITGVYVQIPESLRCVDIFVQKYLL